jgi:hypothetical protein
MKNDQTAMWGRASKNGEAWNYASPSRVAFPNRNARWKKMPLLFYFPLIIWMGMLEAMQAEMRVPATAKTRR